MWDSVSHTRNEKLSYSFSLLNTGLHHAWPQMERMPDCSSVKHYKAFILRLVDCGAPPFDTRLRRTHHKGCVSIDVNERLTKV